MAGAVHELHPAEFSKEKYILILCKSYNSFLVTDEYAVAKHTLCNVENCHYHILLKYVSLNQLLNILSGQDFKYQCVDDVYFCFKYFMNKLILTKGNAIDKLKKAVNYGEKHPSVLYQPSVAKKRLLRKKFHRLGCRKKNVHTQTHKKSFDQRIYQILSGKYAFDFMQILDCLVDGYGFVNTKLVNFQCI